MMILENKLYQNTECTVFILKHTRFSTWTVYLRQQNHNW